MFLSGSCLSASPPGRALRCRTTSGVPSTAPIRQYFATSTFERYPSAVTWWKVSIHNATDARKHQVLQESFEAIFVAFGAPKDAGLFGEMNAEYHVYYFSPGAAEIAIKLIQAHSGEHCEPPTREGLTTLLAHADLSAIPFANL